MKLVPKNATELTKMRVAGKLAAATLDAVTPLIKPGVNTLELNDFCEKFMRERGGVPATIGYMGYAHASCISLNEVVCHGIPAATTVLREGDILNIDVTALVDGFHGDTSRMYWVGHVSPLAQQITRAAYAGMMAGIGVVQSGVFLHEIGNAIEEAVQAVAKPQRFGIVRDYCGHGLGRKFHEAPQVLHYAHTPSNPVRLRKGLTLTIEPMVNVGSWQTVLDDKDGWTVRTVDGSLSAQFEHTLAVTDEGVEILTQSPMGYTQPPYV
jgi:methionyl aminopeptidase